MVAFADGREIGEKESLALPKSVVCIAELKETADVFARFSLPLPREGGEEETGLDGTRDYSYIAISTPNPYDEQARYRRSRVYLAKGMFLLFRDADPLVETLLHELRASSDDPMTPDDACYRFFYHLIEKDARLLEEIEEEIAGLEDDIAKEMEGDWFDAVSELRKSLLRFKRYYEALLALYEDIEENHNAVLGKESQHRFHFLTARAERLYHSVLNLRDYVTQVREAYQAQMDISLNTTMKLFTVVTTIFLPLSLIVGWYGMNIYMPELEYRGMYPVVIGASLVVVVACIVYFRKKRWF